MLVDKITTDYYKVLALLYEKSTLIENKRVALLTQNEIAILSGISTVTVSHIMKELQKDKLIEYQTNVFARYYITDKGIEIVKKIKSIRD